MGEEHRALKHWRAAALGLLSLVCAGGALWWVVRSFDGPTFWRQATHLDWRWVMAAVFFDVLSYVGQGYRWRQLLRPITNLSPWRTTRAIYAGLFVNEVVPMRPGEAVRGLIVAQESGLRISRILPSMVAERLMDGVWLMLAIVCSSFFVSFPGSIQRFTTAAAGICGVLLLALILARKRIPVSWLNALQNRAAFATSVVILLGQGLAVWSVLKACHLGLSPFAGMVTMLVLRVGTMLPAAPANVGTHQLSTMLGLSLFGISHTISSSIAFIVFAVLTIPLWFAGLLAIASLGLPLRSVLRIHTMPEPA